MTTEEILSRLREEWGDEGLVTADGFDDAIIGLAEGWFMGGRRTVVAYDYDKYVEILMERDGMTEEDAEEWMSFNVLGAYVGETTPVFIRNWRD